MAKLGSEPLVSDVLHFFLEARSRSSSFGLVSGSSDSRVQLKIANVITPIKMAFEQVLKVFLVLVWHNVWPRVL